MWQALAAAGASSAASYFGQKDANKANRSIAREQMAFQERMSSTAHQREVADLRAAGLNPILSAGGGGASAPPGASAVMQSELEGAASTAGSYARLKEDLKAIRQGVKESKSRTELQKAQAFAAEKTAERESASAAMTRLQMVPLSMQTDFLNKNPWFVPMQKYLETFGTVLGSARDAAVTYRGFKGFDGVTERFGPQGEHRSTDIWRRR